MAISSFTAGYGPQCTMSDNGAGAVRITFPAYDFDWELYSEIAVDGSHYIYNQTTTTSAAITAKGGTENTGYYFDIGGTSYPDASWNSTDRCVPTLQAAANNYNTPNLAFAAMASMDTMIVAYADTNNATFFTGGTRLASSGVIVSILGLLSRQRVTFGNAISNLSYTGDYSAQSTQCKLRNYTSIQAGSTWHCDYNPGAGQAGAGVALSRLHCIAGYGCIIRATATASTCTVTNCIFEHMYTGVEFASAQTASYVSVIRSQYNTYCFDNNSTTSTWNNCVGVAGSKCFQDVTNGTFNKCASTDNTGSEVGLQSLTVPGMYFWINNDNSYYVPSFRITTSSSLYHTGTPVGGITTDIDGVTRDATNPSIGAHEGTAGAYPGPAASISGTFTAAQNSTQNSITLTLSGLSTAGADYYVFKAKIDGSPTYICGACPISGTTTWDLFNDEDNLWFTNDDITIDVGIISSTTGTVSWLGDPQTVAAKGYLTLV